MNAQQGQPQPFHYAALHWRLTERLGRIVQDCEAGRRGAATAAGAIRSAGESAPRARRPNQGWLFSGRGMPTQTEGR